jgi:predicted PurR-regulated permease PerM
MDLYRALKEAGASDEAASEAAKSVAGQLPRFWAITGTLATVVALLLGLLWLQMQAVDRMASFDQRLASLEQRVSAVDSRLTEFEQRVTGQLDQIMQQLEQLRAAAARGQQ